MQTLHRRDFLIALASLASGQRNCHGVNLTHQTDTIILDPAIKLDIQDAIKRKKDEFKLSTLLGITLIKNDYSKNIFIPAISLSQISTSLDSILFFLNPNIASINNIIKLENKKKYAFRTLPIETRENIRTILNKQFFLAVGVEKVASLNHIIKILSRREAVLRRVEVENRNIFFVLEGPFGPNREIWNFIIHNDFRFQIGGVNVVNDGSLAIGIVPNDRESLKKIFSPFSNSILASVSQPEILNNNSYTLGEIFKFISEVEDIEYLVNENISKYQLQVLNLKNANLSTLKEAIVTLFGVQSVQSPDKRKIYVSYKRLMELNAQNSKNAIRNYIPPQVADFYRDNYFECIKKKGVDKNRFDKLSSNRATSIMFDNTRNIIFHKLLQLEKEFTTPVLLLKNLPEEVVSLFGLLFLCTVDILVRSISIGFPEWAENLEDCDIEVHKQDDNAPEIVVYYKSNIVSIVKT